MSYWFNRSFDAAQEATSSGTTLKDLLPIVTQTIVFSATNVLTTLLFLSLLTFLFFINIGRILNLVLSLLFPPQEDNGKDK